MSTTMSIAIVIQEITIVMTNVIDVITSVHQVKLKRQLLKFISKPFIPRWLFPSTPRHHRDTSQQFISNNLYCTLEE